jgi:hypothetical protein
VNFNVNIESTSLLVLKILTENFKFKFTIYP